MMKKTLGSGSPSNAGGAGNEDVEVSWRREDGEKLKVEREDGCWLGFDEAAWSAVRDARSASMSKPGNSITQRTLVKLLVATEGWDCVPAPQWCGPLQPPSDKLHT